MQDEEVNDMRLISQDGTCDVPYKQVVISLNNMNAKEIIICHLATPDINHAIPMARYSTVGQAKKAMEMLRKAYSYPRSCDCFRFPQDSEVEV